MQLKFRNIFFLLVLVAANAVAQYSPYFQNYSLSEYNAGNQNWGLTKDENGKLFVANNNGLLEFDGLKWDLNELPNRTTIRSVLAYENKIFTGSYEEFGYWEKTKKGNLAYTSLSDKIDPKEFPNQEFWEILEFKGSVIFRSFSNIYIYKNKEITKINIKTQSTIMSCSIIKDKLYVSTLKKGIFVLENDSIIPVINDEFLIDTKVISIIEYKDNLMVMTSLKGSYIYDGNELTPWKTEINSHIKKDQLNSFSKLGNGNMVFGTIKNGVYITNISGKILFHINKENGLINNTVLNQYVDANNELWLGLDNGIALVKLDNYLSFFNDLSGRLGAVYDVKSFKSRIYIGSNTGLYFLDKENNLQFVENSQGQVWELKIIDGQLFCGHNNGTYLVEKDKLKLISNYTGGWTLKKVPEQRNTYLQGTYGGIVKFFKEHGKWNAKHLGTTTMPIRFMVFEDEHIAWIAHAYRGLYRVKFDENYDKIIDLKSYENKGLYSNFNVRVHKLKNDICFKTNIGWQKYEPLLDSIVPFTLLNKNIGKDSYVISNDEMTRLAVKDKDIIKLKSFYDENDDLFLTSRYFHNRLIVGYEKISKINDSSYALTLNDGFMLINQEYNSIKNVLVKPTIEKIEIDNQLIEIDSLQYVELPYNTNNISLSLSSASSKNHFFEYAIQNSDTLKWNLIDNEKLELSNLSDGEYTVFIRTSNDFGDLSTNTMFKLNVLPPWYKGRAGGILYFIILLLVVLLFYLLHKRKINKEQKLLQQKFENEQQEILKIKTVENNRRIFELRNESLKNEIKLKSKQLANTAMALVKKNEALLDIKKELLLHKNSFNNPFSFKKIQKRIDYSIGHEDEWAVFEHNFNQVHEAFFNQLKEQFPKLTHKDLKICAYIKMNLTTKEIAPLLNISTRGVETHRYRLKRKLNLDNDNSLASYLRNFK